MQRKIIIVGKETKYTQISSWRGPLVEIRQHDSLSGENIVFLNDELILKLAEIIKRRK